MINNIYDYEHTAGYIRVVLKIRREYFHVALMTASLLSTILKTSRTQPMLLTTCGLLIAMKSYKPYALKLSCSYDSGIINRYFL